MYFWNRIILYHLNRKSYSHPSKGYCIVAKYANSFNRPKEFLMGIQSIQRIFIGQFSYNLGKNINVILKCKKTNINSLLN